MKKSFIISWVLLISINGKSQLSENRLDTGNQLSTIEGAHMPDVRLHSRKNITIPLPAQLMTIDNDVIRGSIEGVNDSSVVIRQKNKSSTEINFSSIREIKLRKKQHFLNCLGIGAGIGLLPVLGGAISGKSESGAAYVGLISFPLGVLTGGIIGTSWKKFHINGNAASFNDFKNRIK